MLWAWVRACELPAAWVGHLQRADGGVPSGQGGSGQRACALQLNRASLPWSPS